MRVQDDDKLNSQVDICGAITVGVSAVDASGTALSHVTTVVMNNNKNYLKFDYTGWPASLLERTITVTVEAWHSTYTGVKATKTV